MPRRVMVHKTTEFKPDEVDGCLEAFHLCESVDLIQVVEDVGWRAALHEQPRVEGQAQSCTRGRGLALLWTLNAMAPSATSVLNFSATALACVLATSLVMSARPPCYPERAENSTERSTGPPRSMSSKQNSPCQ